MWSNSSTRASIRRVMKPSGPLSGLVAVPRHHEEVGLALLGRAQDHLAGIALGEHDAGGETVGGQLGGGLLDARLLDRVLLVEEVVGARGGAADILDHRDQRDVRPERPNISLTRRARSAHCANGHRPA
jgi:hypothetical protein